MSGTVARETYLPDDSEDVARVYDFLAAHEQSGRGQPTPSYYLSGPGTGERVELPRGAYQVLRDVIEAMRHNLAVTVVPQEQTLTTQQAADLLGVSRPTVIKLLDAGSIPYERVGTHRRVLLRDLLAYRTRRRAEQYAALEAILSDDDEDPAEALERARTARRAVAAQRRTHT